ncbi:probable thiol methyltransferase 2 isoform X2 [Tripterygium wilfordii]|uniref:probable thiol methyltransferase 2 isoform X2 n=1 Tax=Tripterygium wilfordii TaxID=458696 RepID=UPI0018F8141B|nr:probable thiol methyltransferase 2 isoform X2 [Tripterygium wilfordii]
MRSLNLLSIAVTLRSTTVRAAPSAYLGTRGMGKKSNTTNQVNPRVDKLQQVLNSDSSGGWDRCWEEGLTPWDLGKPTPILLHLHKTGALRKGRALVPGCGSLSSTSPNAKYFTFLKADFFSWSPTELFDLIFDYTFFCAIEPEMRSEWAHQIQKFLKPEGELITLMFPISHHVGGPPFKVSIADYEEVLHPMGFKAISIVDNQLAVGPRRGREKLGRWKRSLSQSLL